LAPLFAIPANGTLDLASGLCEASPIAVEDYPTLLNGVAYNFFIEVGKFG
jgi:hypothetical protein